MLDYSVSLAQNLRVLGDLYGGLGMQNLGDTSRAVEYYRRAADITRQLAIHFPANLDAQKAQYHALLSLAGTEKAIGRLEDSTADLRRVVDLIDKVMQQHPNDAPAQVELANAGAQLGQSLLDARKPDEALPYIARSVKTLERLSAIDSKNAFYRRSFGILEAQYAATLRASGHFTEALKLNRYALTLAETLTAESPESLEYHADVGIDHRKLAETLLAAGDAHGALDHAGQASARFCGLAETSGHAYIKANCGRALLFAGLAESALRRALPAVNSYRRAEAMASAVSHADPANAVFRSDLARTEASFAAGLAEVHQNEEAGEQYRRALADWAALRKSKAITAEDSHRAESAAQALPALSKNI